MDLVKDTRLRLETLGCYLGYQGQAPGVPNPYGHRYAGSYYYLKTTVRMGLSKEVEHGINLCVNEWMKTERGCISDLERETSKEFGMPQTGEKLDRAILYGRVACKSLFSEMVSMDAGPMLTDALKLTHVYEPRETPLVLPGISEEVVKLLEKGYDLEQIEKVTGQPERIIRYVIAWEILPKDHKVAA